MLDFINIVKLDKKTEGLKLSETCFLRYMHGYIYIYIYIYI